MTEHDTEIVVEDATAPARDSPRVTTHRTVEIVVYVLLLGLATLLAYDNWRIGAGWAREGPQAGYLPFHLCVILAGACLFGLGQTIRRQRQEAKTFVTRDQLLREHGSGHGCEICKPTVASILASIHNDPILDEPHRPLQDSNDRFLANIQKNGTYSVVPRMPAGEVTPDQLIAIGRVANKYGLSTKITGGQRIDLFGARVEQLPAIWEELIAAGFESGHAYGKAMRTVKSSVGSMIA